jgi:hypothetical protein
LELSLPLAQGGGQQHDVLAMTLAQEAPLEQPAHAAQVAPLAEAELEARESRVKDS